jgi:hypothetical protein
MGEHLYLKEAQPASNNGPLWDPSEIHVRKRPRYGTIVVATREGGLTRNEANTHASHVMTQWC